MQSNNYTIPYEYLYTYYTYSYNWYVSSYLPSNPSVTNVFGVSMPASNNSGSTTAKLGQYNS